MIPNITHKLSTLKMIILDFISHLSPEFYI